MQIMHWLRLILLHVVVWLTAAATLLAGIPQLQCRCPSGTVMPACPAPAAPASCCCCTDVAEDSDETPPSCCHPTPAQPGESTDPNIGRNACQKAVVEPAPAIPPRAASENVH